MWAHCNLVNTILPVWFMSESVIRKLSSLAGVVFVIEFSSFAKVLVFLVTWVIMDSVRGKEKVSDNGGHNIMKYSRNLVQFDSLQVKWHLKSRTKSFVNELLQELPNNLRPRVSKTYDLRKLESYRNISKMVKAEPSTQSLFQKKSFGTSGQNLYKIRYQVSRPVQFCLISWPCFINFFRDCLNK